MRFQSQVVGEFIILEDAELVDVVVVGGGVVVVVIVIALDPVLWRIVGECIAMGVVDS